MLSMHHYHAGTLQQRRRILYINHVSLVMRSDHTKLDVPTYEESPVTIMNLKDTDTNRLQVPSSKL